MTQPPLRDALLEPSGATSLYPRTSSRLSLGLPRSRGGRPTLLTRSAEASDAKGVDAASSSSSSSPSTARAPSPVLTGLELRKKYEDDSIRGTDGDALGSRLSALQAGYFANVATDATGVRSTSSWAAADDPWSPLFSGGGAIAPLVPPTTMPMPTGTSSGPSSARGLLPALRPLAPPPVTRRPPIINIGTFLRCEKIDALVQDFLLGQAHDTPAEDKAGRAKGKGRQIISLGAGSDARYWRITSNARLAPHLSHYLELDFPQVVSKKLAAIQRFPKLQEHLIPPSESPQSNIEVPGEAQERSADLPCLHTQRYTLQSCDLRLLSSSSLSATSTSSTDPLAYLDPDVPTLILAECVLAYMPPDSSVHLLQRIASRIHLRNEVRGVCYEMCVAGDETAFVATMATSATGTTDTMQEGQHGGVSKFGKVMLANLETRGLSLQGARAFPTPTSHAERFGIAFTPSSLQKGLRVETHAASLRQIWRRLPSRERERLSRLEGLDEVEELELLLSCYCLSWAIRPAWTDLRGHRTPTAGGEGTRPGPGPGPWRPGADEVDIQGGSRGHEREDGGSGERERLRGHFD